VKDVKKAPMRTTKPPVPKNKKGVKQQKIEQIQEMPDVQKPNYHYAKEVLKKDQDRLKKSTYKQKKGVKVEEKVEKPSRKPRPISRGPVKEPKETSPSKHSFMKKKTNKILSHSNAKQRNQDLEDVFQTVDEISKKFEAKEEETVMSKSELDQIRKRIQEPFPCDDSFDNKLDEPNVKSLKLPKEPQTEHKIQNKLLESSNQNYTDPSDNLNSFGYNLDHSKEPSQKFEELEYDMETPKHRESPAKLQSKPTNVKRPKLATKKAAALSEPQIVYKN
jgi:hypothetical protein